MADLTDGKLEAGQGPTVGDVLSAIWRLGPRGKHARLTLRELGQLAGGLHYASAGQAVSRFGKRLERRTELRQTVTKIENELSNV